MKVNTFTSILSFGFAGLIAFFLSFYVSGENKWILGIGSFLTLAISMAGTVSLSFDYDRTTMLTRTTSGVFFALLLVSQIIFLVMDVFLLPTYILVTGGMTILYVLIVYGISRSKH
jgi:hypothetical protein